MTPRKKTAAERLPVRPSRRGWMGRGGGYDALLPNMPMWRGTSVQVCGLNPWRVGAGAPSIGVPLGRHLWTGATVGVDPISWFDEAGFIGNPSAFILGLPGMGKSTIIRQWMLFYDAFGINTMVLGDLKPDMVATGAATGAQIIGVGHGRGYLNILDPGDVITRSAALPPEEREAIRADAHQRRVTMLSALLTISRGSEPTDREISIMDAALRVLDDKHEGVPVIADMLHVIQRGPEPVRAVAVDRGDWSKYQAIIEPLEASLIAMITGGRLGEVFARQTTTPMMMDRSVVYDLSGIDKQDTNLRAAALMACWSNGFSAIALDQKLADHGLVPRKPWLVVMDELWMALRSGPGQVERADTLTRLNRNEGVGQVYASHTMSDLNALPTEEDRSKARGFIERAGMVICGALPQTEMAMLNEVVPFSASERALVSGWVSPPSWGARPGSHSGQPPGLGKFLVKVGGRAGIPLQTFLTPTAATVNDTNTRWAGRAEAARQRRGQEASA